MPHRSIILTEEQDTDIAEIVRRVAREQKAVRVVLNAGETVLILPSSDLRPLPELEGAVPEGWKDAVYRQ